MPKRPYPRWQRRHEVVLIWLFENPSKKLRDCAAATGYSVTHISRIINAPDFRRRYETLRDARFKLMSQRVIGRISHVYSYTK